MTTRRRFIAANMIGAAGCTLLPKLAPADASQPFPSSSSPETTGLHQERDFWNDWPAYVTRQMNGARAKRLAQLAWVDSAPRAQARSEKVRETLWKILGGPLEKTPLNARITHSRNRGYCRIDTLILESLPAVFVTADLYVPLSGTPPFPAILAPVGHASNGKAYAAYQHFFQNLARQGFIVLTYDPWGQGERFQYRDPNTGQSRFEPTGEHSQAGRPMVLLGDGLARYLAWDGIRALDYLLTRPDVDANRIGCAGHSGGGTMTMYLAALEPRIHVAAAIEGNTENLAGPFYDPPGAIDDAEQNIVGSLPFEIDRGDLLSAFAPKPLLICYTTYDVGETYSPFYKVATEEIYHDVRRIYSFYGKEDQVSLFSSHLPHDLDYFNRRQAYNWFSRWLKGGAAAEEEVELDVFPEELLNATETGQVLSSTGCRSVVQVNADRLLQVLPKGRFLLETVDLAALRIDFRNELLKLLALPAEKSPLDPKVLSSNLRRNTLIEEIQFRSEPEIRISGWFAKSSSTDAQRPAVLYIAENGGEDITNDPGSMDRVLAHGVSICTIALRGVGITAPRMPASGPNYFSDPNRREDGLAWASLVLGLPAIGQRVWDVLRGIDYLASRQDVDPSQIRIIGRGSAGIAAQLAAFLDGRVRALLLDRTLASYSSLVESPDYSVRVEWFVPGILRHFDLPDLGAAMSPRPCWVLNGADPNGNPLPEDSIREAYRKRVGEKWLTAGHLRLLVKPINDPQESYLEWINNS
jgi:cephalosporin-C deacetylase-like acetyl esterase